MLFSLTWYLSFIFFKNRRLGLFQACSYFHPLLKFVLALKFHIRLLRLRKGAFLTSLALPYPLAPNPVIFHLVQRLFGLAMPTHAAAAAAVVGGGGVVPSPAGVPASLLAKDSTVPILLGVRDVRAMLPGRPNQALEQGRPWS
jgi:hypothetical protein